MSGKKKLRGVIVIMSLAILYFGSATGLFAQDAGLLKKLILEKFDYNNSGALVGIEKDEAVTFLKKADKDRNDEISEEEATAVIVALRKMPNPKLEIEKDLEDDGLEYRRLAVHFILGKMGVTELGDVEHLEYVIQPEEGQGRFSAESLESLEQTINQKQKCLSWLEALDAEERQKINSLYLKSLDSHSPMFSGIKIGVYKK